MSIVRTLYVEEPSFPATDQHPDAVRYPCNVGGFLFVDAIGGEPTVAELEAVLGIDAAGLARQARLTQDEDERLSAKGDAALLQLVNATPQQLQTYAQNNFPSLTLAEQNRMALILYALAVAVRPLIRQ
jgi:hypothetical protein